MHQRMGTQIENASWTPPIYIDLYHIEMSEKIACRRTKTVLNLSANLNA